MKCCMKVRVKDDHLPALPSKLDQTSLSRPSSSQGGRKSKDRRTKIKSSHLRNELRKINNEPFVHAYLSDPIPYVPSTNPITPYLLNTAKLLASSILFQDVSESQLVRVAQQMTQISLGPESKIIQQGDNVYKDDCLFLIEEGQVEVRIATSSPSSINMGAGELFGELGVLFGANRSASVFSATAVTLSCLSRNDLLSMLKFLPSARLLLFLRSLSLLQGLTDSQILNLAPLTQHQMFEDGQTIITYGTRSDSIYIVFSGRVQVLLPQTDYKVIAHVTPGKLIGQRAVMTNKTRSASCVAKGSVEVLKIAAKHFANINNPVLEWVMDSEAVLAVLRICTNSETAESLLDTYTKKKVDKGVTLLHSGERSHTIYIVCSGGITGGKEVDGYTYCGTLWDLPIEEKVMTTHPTVLIICENPNYKGTGSSPWEDTIALKQQIEMQDLIPIKHVAKGSVGSVDLVRCRDTQQLYCLKRMQCTTDNAKVIRNEALIMQQLNSPFCVKLYSVFESAGNIGLLLEWVQGGELFYHLDMHKAFTESQARFYAACVIIGLQHVHAHGVLYRDLKPENLLLDMHGYPKLADFGFAKQLVDEFAYTMCGTMEYQAPEILTRQGHTEAADWWSLGVLIYEMLVGDPPFKANEDMHGSTTGGWGLMRATQAGRYFMPPHVSSTASSLISSLLHVQPEKRLPGSKIKDHPWFSTTDWEALSLKKLKAPIIPQVNDPTDTFYYT